MVLLNSAVSLPLTGVTTSGTSPSCPAIKWVLHGVVAVLGHLPTDRVSGRLHGP
jgi:hypothetical protein